MTSVAVEIFGLLSQIGQREADVHKLDGRLRQKIVEERDPQKQVQEMDARLHEAKYASSARHQCLQANAMEYLERMHEVLRAPKHSGGTRSSKMPSRVCPICYMTFASATRKILNPVTLEALALFKRIGGARVGSSVVIELRTIVDAKGKQCSRRRRFLQKRNIIVKAAFRSSMFDKVGSTSW